MKLRSRTLLFLLLSLSAAAGWAQTSTITLGGAAIGVTGVPFSADTTNESTQVLADGNRIHRETHGKMFRDSEGRTRTEIESAPPLPGAQTVRHVIIHDPVERVFMLLDPDNKIARIHHLSAISPTDSAIRRPPVQVLRQQDSDKSEQLGTMDVESLTVYGTRHTRTTPAGAIGNENPLVRVMESWFSPELKATLISVTDDPRLGHTSTTLSNIQRSEPDPSLFQVPPDYQVKDENPR